MVFNYITLSYVGPLKLYCTVDCVIVDFCKLQFPSSCWDLMTRQYKKKKNSNKHNEIK